MGIYIPYDSFGADVNSFGADVNSFGADVRSYGVNTSTRVEWKGSDYDI